MPWIRLDASLHTDPTLEAIAVEIGPAAWAGWVAIICACKLQTREGRLPGGLSAAWLARRICCDAQTADRCLAAYEEAGMISDGRIAWWSRYQIDPSGDRVASHRSRHVTVNTVTRPVSNGEKPLLRPLVTVCNECNDDGTGRDRTGRDRTGRDPDPARDLDNRLDSMVDAEAAAIDADRRELDRQRAASIAASIDTCDEDLRAALAEVAAWKPQADLIFLEGRLRAMRSRHGLRAILPVVVDARAYDEAREPQARWSAPSLGGHLESQCARYTAAARAGRGPALTPATPRRIGPDPIPEAPPPPPVPEELAGRSAEDLLAEWREKHPRVVAEEEVDG